MKRLKKKTKTKTKGDKMSEQIPDCINNTIYTCYMTS